jgi:site-specific DNA-methyltransferase (adenine-specific)
MIETNRIYNEDCLVGMQRIENCSIDCIICDLPYGITRNKWDKTIPFEPLWAQYKRIIKQNGAILLFSSEPFASHLRLSNLGMYKYDLIWNKKSCSGFLNAKKQPLRSHEIICVFYQKPPTYNPQFSKRKHERDFTTMIMKPHSTNFGRQRNYKSTIRPDSPAYPRSVIEIAGVVGNSKEKTPHPTQKPVALMEYLIKTYTIENDLVLDNCIGSGTTAIAAYNANRNFIGFEVNKEYYDISMERLNNVLNTPKQKKLFTA